MARVLIAAVTCPREAGVTEAASLDALFRSVKTLVRVEKSLLRESRVLSRVFSSPSYPNSVSRFLTAVTMAGAARPRFWRPTRIRKPGRR